MKHSAKITAILISMFVVAQLIGLAVSYAYTPVVKQVVNETTGEVKNITIHELPYGTAPPEELTPRASIISIIIALVIAIAAMLIFMRYHLELVLRLWFFIVVTLALAVVFNALLINIPSFNSYQAYFQAVALIAALPFAYIKIFKRQIIVHNLTELLIYPGVAAIFVAFLSIGTMVFLLILISAWDIYAVWHSGIMQKMAKYQIKKLRLFTGFFVPYLSKKDKLIIEQAKKQKIKGKKLKIAVAILGGGDVVFPMMLAGIVLRQFNLLSALLIVVGATLALGYLLYIGEKGKFYPAMPFITTGCLIALAVVYLLEVL